MLNMYRCGIRSNMICKFIKESRIGLKPSITATNPSILIMGLHITHLTNIAKKTTNKALNITRKR